MSTIFESYKSFNIVVINNTENFLFGCYFESSAALDRRCSEILDLEEFCYKGLSPENEFPLGTYDNGFFETAEEAIASSKTKIDQIINEYVKLRKAQLNLFENI